MMLLASTIVLALTTASPLPRAAVVVRATGFADADAAKLDEKVAAEVAARGFETVRIADAEANCLTTRACARDLVRGAGATALVRVDLVRGGGSVQIAAAVIDQEGRASDDVTGLARLTSLLGGDAVLPPAFLPVLVATKPPLEATSDAQTPPPDSTTNNNPKNNNNDAQDAPANRPDDVIDPPGEAQPLSTLALGAIGGIGVGALAIAVGAVGATGQYRVTRDPNALGADKERAAVLVPVLVVVSVVGAGLAGASGWILMGELD